ncbi:hypothetical protein EXIGLDRAFT_151809 [Exidia glandulosa HHB12029]|uniref:Uncharacterized protein n=1 Tax=Exidia glandulosa HHB12029 TaxID=1314781 RepID=A0A165QDH9_EXIGL|nr:hypothetical protein EXIGLDRAFT_151809 [Exidia glandulosa HHB12029]
MQQGHDPNVPSEPDRQHVQRAKLQPEARPFRQPVARGQKRAVWPRKAPPQRALGKPSRALCTGSMITWVMQRATGTQRRRR